MLQAWQVFAGDYGLDALDTHHKAHGRRLYDTLKEYCHIADEDTLQVRPCVPVPRDPDRTHTLTPRPRNTKAEIVRFEELVILGGPIVLPGALSLLHRVRTRTRCLSSHTRPSHSLARPPADWCRQLRDRLWVDDRHLRCVRRSQYVERQRH